MFNKGRTDLNQKGSKINGVSSEIQKRWWQYTRPSYGYGWLFILFYYSQFDQVWRRAGSSANPLIILIGAIITFFIYFKARKRFVNENNEITWLSAFIGNIVGFIFTLVYLWSFYFSGLLFM